MWTKRRGKRELNCTTSYNVIFIALYQVTVGFSEESAQPGDAITVNASADADTPVLVGIIDTSLTLLAESCKSLQSASVSDHYTYSYC